jgi:hypothetical protein
MYKDILRSIGGIDVFPVFSLIVFLAVFAVAVVRTLRIGRRELAHLSSLPLDGGEPGAAAEDGHDGATEEGPW